METLNGYLYDFSVDYNAVDKSKIVKSKIMYKYLVLNHNIKDFILLSKYFLYLSFSGSLATKWVSLNNEPCVGLLSLI